MGRRAVFIVAVLLLALPLALGACGGEGKQSITGQVVAVDAQAQTFAVQTSDGQRYDFKKKSGGNVNLTHIKEHMDEKKQIKVEYSGETSPYEASYAH